MIEFEITLISFLALIISVWDIKYKKIPNVFILTIIGVIIVNDVLKTGWESIFTNLLWLLLSFLAFIILWGILAAGDVKLLIAFALLIGIKNAWLVFFISVFVAALFYLFKNPVKTVKGLKSVVYRIVYQIGISSKQKTTVVAYSPFIVVSFYLIVYVWGV